MKKVLINTVSAFLLSLMVIAPANANIGDGIVSGATTVLSSPFTGDLLPFGLTTATVYSATIACIVANQRTFLETVPSLYVVETVSCSIDMIKALLQKVGIFIQGLGVVTQESIARLNNPYAHVVVEVIQEDLMDILRGDELELHPLASEIINNKRVQSPELNDIQLAQISYQEFEIFKNQISAE